MAGKRNDENKFQRFFYTNRKLTFSQMDEAYRYALQSNTNFSFFASEHIMCRWTYKIRLISISSIWEKSDDWLDTRHSTLNQSKLKHIVFHTLF